ncbi:acid-shock protein [Providencia rettgeri]|uniref:acid-shock protein n=1 Tax=Providencia sp. TaxID=589 RepID=UPI0024ABCBAD|nr:acid-shock protein [Providencia rettgeri]
MKTLLAIATVMSIAISGAALANTTVKSEPVSPIAQSHQAAKSSHMKAKVEKKAAKEKHVEKSKSAK